MLHVGMDLSRQRLDMHVMDEGGRTMKVLACKPDRDGLTRLANRIADCGEDVIGVIESMNGARFVHDTLERAGWRVEIADAQKVKGLAPLACKTDRIDSYVLAELSRRDLVPAIWLPSPDVRADRERSRWRLHLVRHRTSLKNRIHAMLLAFGRPCPTSDLFGVKGREALKHLYLPEPWTSNMMAALSLIDHLTDEIKKVESELRTRGVDHEYVPLLLTVPGISWVLAYTIASEIGDIRRFAVPKKLVGYTGLCPRVYQSGEKDYRGSLSKNGPEYLRWALIEAAVHAAHHPVYSERYQRTAKRLGRQRGRKVARVALGRELCEAIWHMLTKHEPFDPFIRPSAEAA